MPVAKNVIWGKDVTIQYPELVNLYGPAEIKAQASSAKNPKLKAR
jgi:hypothetical protein